MRQNLNPFAPGRKPRGGAVFHTPESKKPRRFRRGSSGSRLEKSYFGGALEDELFSPLFSPLFSALFL